MFFLRSSALRSCEERAPIFAKMQYILRLSAIQTCKNTLSTAEIETDVLYFGEKKDAFFSN